MAKTSSTHSLLALYIAMNIISLLFLFSANFHSYSYVGTLKSAYISNEPSCSSRCNDEGKYCHTTCSDNFYVNQIFLKNIDTRATCTLKSYKLYYYRGDADNYMSLLDIGMSKVLYQSMFSYGTCIDEEQKLNYNWWGKFLLAITNSWIVICILMMINDYFHYHKTKFISLFYTSESYRFTNT